MVRTVNRWVAAVSTRHIAALVLLELLWTKISSFCDTKMPFGDDMEIGTLVELFALQAVTSTTGVRTAPARSRMSARLSASMGLPMIDK